jgi:hypothetical protein
MPHQHRLKTKITKITTNYNDVSDVGAEKLALCTSSCGAQRLLAS